jgi:carbon monoxide dehydrogenase subunit G
MMRADGRYASQSDKAALWAVLGDPQRLAAALPGVTEFEEVGDARLTATARPSTNLGVTPMRLEMRIIERTDGGHVRVVGHGIAGESRVRFQVALYLASRPGSGCDVTWDAEVQAYGPLASLTQRVLPALLRNQLVLVLEAAERQTRGVTPA